MSTAEPGYLHAESEFGAELVRLNLLQARHDPVTRDRLDRLGVPAGARCLEVGAGAGSVARLLAAAAGPTGHVVATDRDPRFLTDCHIDGGAPIEVRRHDILSDPLEVARYDLVHCRALLLHLPDPELALSRMAAALAPGGRLLVEDVDFSTFAAVSGHPAAERFDRYWRAAWRRSGDEASFDPYLGKRLAGLVEKLGLTDRGEQTCEFRRTGGGVEARMYHQGFVTLGHRYAGTVEPEEIAAVAAALLDPTFAFDDARNVGVWGTRPEPGYFG